MVFVVVVSKTREVRTPKMIITYEKHFSKIILNFVEASHSLKEKSPYSTNYIQMCFVAEMIYLMCDSSTFYSIIHRKEGITFNCQHLLPQSFKTNGKKLVASC